MFSCSIFASMRLLTKLLDICTSQKLPIWVAVLILTSLSACISKKKKQAHKDHLQPTKEALLTDSAYLSVFVFYYAPYCKGIAPQSEDEYRVVTPEKQESFFVYSLNDPNMKWEFTTNEQGMAQLVLPEGSYCVKRSLKNCSFEDFIKKQKGKDSDYIRYGDTACYFKWWNSCEFEFNAQKGHNNLRFEVYTACYTGIDPCKYYMGPLPP
jgi:hypothetical protein